MIDEIQYRHYYSGIMTPHSNSLVEDRRVRAVAQRAQRAQRARARLGIIGSGQLARMLSTAATKLGADVILLDATGDGPASSCATATIFGDWRDPAVLGEFAAAVDVVTIENELVDVHLLAALEAANRPVFPSARTVALVQDKYLQKDVLQRAGLPVARAAPLASEVELHEALQHFGVPAVLKARRNAYDGRGNATIAHPDDAAAAWVALGGDRGRSLYLEEWCAFERELAVIVTRGRDGSLAIYPTVETLQRNHICHLVRAPAPVADAIAEHTADLACRAAVALEAVGSIGVECFLLPGGHVVVNEVAPRVHNSGHYTADACVCSQFENHLRAVFGLPLGSPRMLVPAAVMVNLLGTSTADAVPHGLTDALGVQGASVHLYGKLLSGLDRKLGHVTAVAGSLALAEESAMRCASAIRFGGDQ